MEIERKYTYKGKINLTQQENEIFELFLSISKTLKPPPIIRVAGGWVRDKLLGLESVDIDFAIDTVTGEDFVKHTYKCLQDSTNGEVHGFGVTRFNPEKSKNLETAKIQVKGVWIDIVNLRGETYSGDSRIPEIVIGTPKQDAERRDLTINSLFYNLNTQEVEDFTKKGISDLQEGIIRTPLQPLETFTDDPLRVLRTIRFASRFQFQIVPEILQAAADSTVRTALENKVSRERVGIEVKSILQNENAFFALDLLNRLNILDVLYFFPELRQLSQEQQNEYFSLLKTSFELISACHNHLNLLLGAESYTRSIYSVEEIRFLAYLISICSPFKNCVFKMKKKNVEMGQFIVKEALKVDNFYLVSKQRGEYYQRLS